MTPHELLQAKIAEVRRRDGGGETWLQDMITHAFDVQAENWTPPVDPDLLLARDIASTQVTRLGDATAITEGDWDHLTLVAETLSIIRAHRAKQAGSGG